MRVSDLKRLTAPDRFADGIRVLVALAAVIGYAGLGGNPQELIPLVLGVIAAAIAETDDGPRDRARALAVTLACFSIAAVAVQVLFAQPMLFAPALFAGTFVLVMLGAISARYALIANATLLLSVYTMITVDQQSMAETVRWRQPLLQVAGAGVYGALALAWSAVFVHRPVQQSLARLFTALDDHLVCKSRLFEPTRDLDVQARRTDLAYSNAGVVAALNDTRQALLDRLNGRRSRSAMNVNLRLYLAAQDIHERASSAHYPYRALTQAFFHSDLMFRCQRLMQRLARACADRAAALRQAEAFADRAGVAGALDEFEAALAYQRRAQEQAPGHDLRHAVDDLADNLRALAAKVLGAGDSAPAPSDSELQNPAPDSPIDAARRIWLELTPAAARFRHALRLALAMAAGYGVLLLIQPAQGYWILLTTMLVCQPDYAATRQRFIQRVSGTIAGLVIGWALLRLFPQPEIQLSLTVISGVVFFAARFRRYFVAAAAISVLVLVAFNQVGNGFDLIWPRLMDTLIGGTLAAAAMLLVLPDWRSRELHQRLAAALAADGRYLRAVFAQYRSPRRDDLAYRVARRDAHNADAAVSTHIATAVGDPHGARTDSREAFAVLACTQTLIGHLSALGAHRGQRPAHADTAVLDEAVDHLAASLDAVAQALIHGQPMPAGSAVETDLRRALAAWPEAHADSSGLAAAQLRLLLDELPRLRQIGQRLIS